VASARAIVAKASDVKGLCIAYVSDVADIGVEPEIDDICRSTAMSLRDAGATVEEIAFDISDGKFALSGLARVVDGRPTIRQSRSTRSLRRQSQGQRQGRPQGDAAGFWRIRAEAAGIVPALAELFERYDLLITPQSPVKQFPVEMNFPTLINGRKLDNYTDWIAGSFLITLMSLPAAACRPG